MASTMKQSRRDRTGNAGNLYNSRRIVPFWRMLVRTEPQHRAVDPLFKSRWLPSTHRLWHTGIVSSESDQLMATVEFLTINGQSIRLTSLARDESTGGLSLVVIVRGDAARDELTTLIHDQPLTVSFPNETAATATAAAAETMRVSGLELRSTGEGARTIHRFAISLEPYSMPIDSVPEPIAESAAESALMQRLDAIERKLDRLLALLETSH